MNPFQPPIKECIKYCYKEETSLPVGLVECQGGLQPFPQCMVDPPGRCKGQKLNELTDRLSKHITNTENELFWYAAFGQKLERNKTEDSTVTASFLQWLLTNPKAVKFISTNGVYAKGLKIEGELNLENATIDFPVALEESIFPHGIKLIDAKTRSLSLNGSTCSSIIDASRIRVTGNLQLERFTAEKGINICGAYISGNFNCTEGTFKNDKAFFAKHIQINEDLLLIRSHAKGEINLSGAIINGNLDCRNGNFTSSEEDNPKNNFEVHALDTKLAKVGGSVYFSDSTVIGHVFAVKMEIGGDFDCTGGRITHKTGNCHAISIDRSSIGGNVNLCQGFSAIGQIRLIGTRIAKDLDCSGGKFILADKKNDIALNAPRAQVDGSVFLCGSRNSNNGSRNSNNQPENFETNGWIIFTDTNIDHSVIVGQDGGNNKSIFHGEKSGVSFANAKIKDSLEWCEVDAEFAKLNLSNAKVDVLKTNGEESWPKTLVLDNFVYNKICHPRDDNTIHVKWTKRLENHTPQIYEQLETVLFKNGQYEEATKVHQEGENKRCEKDPKHKRIWNWLRKKAVTGLKWFNTFLNLWPSIRIMLSLIFAVLSAVVGVNYSIDFIQAIFK